MPLLTVMQRLGTTLPIPAEVPYLTVDPWRAAALAPLLAVGGLKVGTRLEEAVTAFREALKETTREIAPLEWARTQMNLGTALASIGERESGTKRLEEAVKAYHEALNELTRENMPLEWARTQTNLGMRC